MNPDRNTKSVPGRFDVSALMERDLGTTIIAKHLTSVEVLNGCQIFKIVEI